MRTSLLRWLCVSLLVLGLSFGGSVAFAENGETNPAGWNKGEKEGWSENMPPMPPGLEKKGNTKGAKKVEIEIGKIGKETGKEIERGAKKVEKESVKLGREAEKETEKLARKSGDEKSQVEKKAEKQKREAEKEAKKKQREAEKEAKKKQKEIEKEAKKSLVM